MMAALSGMTSAFHNCGMRASATWMSAGAGGSQIGVLRAWRSRSTHGVRPARNFATSIMLYCSKMEQNNMSSENCSDQRAAPEHDQCKQLRSPARPPQGGPPILDRGLESLRSSDC
jgi:hypothetical protein